MPELHGNCPRCGGTELYMTARERMTGLGGIYGNRSKMEDVVLCKACGEYANFNPYSPENREFTKEYEKPIYRKYFFFYILPFFVLVTVVFSLLPY